MSTVVSRLKVTHPDLGDVEGFALHAEVRSAWTKLGDNDVGRYAVFAAVANAAVFEVDHNFGVGLDQLQVLIYTGTFPAFTRVDDPEVIAVPWGIAEKAGSEKEVLEITAPAAGGPFTGSIVVAQVPSGEQKTYGTNRAVSAAATLHDRRLHLADSTGAAFTLTLPAPSTDLYIPIKDVGGDASNENITIATPGAETIDGGASYLIDADYQAVTVVSDGTNYFVI